MGIGATMLPSLGINKWSQETLCCLAARISGITRKALILVDGVGGSGKTSLSAKLAGTLNANIISTDDICWNADPIHWDSEAIDNIIKPWLDGIDAAYKPSGWVKENRPGFIHVDSSKTLIIEGMGASRKTLRDLATFSIWVDAEPDIARKRVVERDLASGVNGETLKEVMEFTEWWDSMLIPFLIEEEPWKYVDLIVNGIESDYDNGNLLVSTPEHR